MFLGGEDANVIHIQTHGAVVVLDANGQLAVFKRNVTAGIGADGTTVQIGLVERILVTVQRQAVGNHVGAIQREVGGILGEDDRHELGRVGKRDLHLHGDVQTLSVQIDQTIQHRRTVHRHVGGTVGVHADPFGAGDPIGRAVLTGGLVNHRRQFRLRLNAGRVLAVDFQNLRGDRAIKGGDRHAQIRTAHGLHGIGIEHRVFLGGEDANVIHIQTHGAVVVLDANGQLAVFKRNVTAGIGTDGRAV